MTIDETKEAGGIPDRYSLGAAARLLETHAGEGYGHALIRLAEAVHKDELKAYPSGKNMHYVMEHPRTTARPMLSALIDPATHMWRHFHLRDNYDEVYVEDLNAWLVKHYPRLTYRFPVPATANKSTAPKAFVNALIRLLEEIEKRSAPTAKAISRNALPGTKRHLQELASKFSQELDGYELQTFDDYMKGLCACKKGRRPSGEENPYAALFPEYFNNAP